MPPQIGHATLHESCARQHIHTPNRTVTSSARFVKRLATVGCRRFVPAVVHQGPAKTMT